MRLKFKSYFFKLSISISILKSNYISWCKIMQNGKMCSFYTFWVKKCGCKIVHLCTIAIVTMHICTVTIALAFIILLIFFLSSLVALWFSHFFSLFCLCFFLLLSSPSSSNPPRPHHWPHRLWPHHPCHQCRWNQDEEIVKSELKS